MHASAVIISPCFWSLRFISCDAYTFQLAVFTSIVCGIKVVVVVGVCAFFSFLSISWLYFSFRCVKWNTFEIIWEIMLLHRTLLLSYSVFSLNSSVHECRYTCAIATLMTYTIICVHLALYRLHVNSFVFFSMNQYDQSIFDVYVQFWIGLHFMPHNRIERCRLCMIAWPIKWFIELGYVNKN